MYQKLSNTWVFGEPLDNAVQQMKDYIEPDSVKTALMADHHLGYSQPIGGVAAYQDYVSPAGVGYDIACGCCAVKLSTKYEDIKDHIPEIMDKVSNTISFGLGRKNNEPVDSPVLDKQGKHAEAWNLVETLIDPIIKLKGNTANLHERACEQLGTVGGGNHYVDLFFGEDGHIWVGVHFGSRGLGHKIASYFIGNSKADEKPHLLHIDSQEGSNYLKLMELAGDYAYAGRDWVCSRVASLIGGEIIDKVHNHHNYAFKEDIKLDDGTNLKDCYVVRKGATPLIDRSFIGGTMAEPSVIAGYPNSDEVDDDIQVELDASMNSTVHGAGRLVGRSQAKGKWNKKTGEWKREPKITKESMTDWVNKANVVLRGGDVDEAPQAYKRLSTVLANHASTKIEELLTPVGVCMAGPETYDPYKD